MAGPLGKFLKHHRLLIDATIILTRKTGHGMAFEIDTMEKLGELSAVQKYTIINVRNSLNHKIEEHFHALEEEIHSEVSAVAETAAEIVAEYVSDAISEAVGPRSILPRSESLSQAAIRNIKEGMITSRRGSIDASIARMQGKSYVPLSRRVYHTQALVKGQVNHMINYHLAKGSSGRDLAKDVRRYIQPRAPGGLRGASMRLGRTELNNAFHAVSIDQAKKNPYVTGLTWHLSGSHPRPDRCNDYAEKTFLPGETPAKPHPNCICYVTPVTISKKEFLDHYRRGDLKAPSAVGGVQDQIAGEPARGRYRPLTKSEFSDPTTTRTRAVSAEEFQRIAAEGEKRLASFASHASPPTGLDRNWSSIKSDAYKSVQSEWGGVTVDAHTGKAISGTPKAYALTVRPPGVYSVTVPKGADRATFDAAMDESRNRFSKVLANEHYHLGVFRDDAIDRIDIDPVVVVNDHHDVETIGAYTHAKGGAYNFSDGLGYWPPHVKE